MINFFKLKGLIELTLGLLPDFLQFSTKKVTGRHEGRPNIFAWKILHDLWNPGQIKEHL